MRITTLGLLAVDGRPVRGDRLATVLRALIDAPGRAVPAGALIDAVWPEAPPTDAAGALQALVGRVRRLGVPVRTTPGGYLVPADEVQIDAVTARELIERGRRALSSGDVVGALDGADAARALFPGPDDGRLFGDVVTLRAEAALACGGPYDEADLRVLVGRVPLDEPAAALLVRVLAAQGRDAEALDLFDRIRAELIDLYGADPSPVLAEAHLALLRGELAPPLARQPGPPAELAGIPSRRASGLPAGWRRAATPLVGRDADLAAIGEALREAPLVTVVATGGAGKTRLAAEIARSFDGTRPVRVVELAGLRSPSEVLPAVLAALGGPAPNGTAPSGPASSNPALRGPASIGPAVSSPAPSNTHLSGSAPASPTVSNPAPASPALSGPAPASPALSGPAPAAPAPSGPALSGPAPSSPALSSPALRDPAPNSPALSAPSISGLAIDRRVLSPEEQLQAVGAEFDGLLVVDNCEHLLEATAAVVADLLAAIPPEAAVLATSRAPLGLLGEVVHRLPALPDNEALALLEARVRSGGATPTWPRDQALDLCHRLDNLPLALELAAARLRNLPIADVLAFTQLDNAQSEHAQLNNAQLNNALRGLSLRGLPQRHSNLKALLDWSRDLLEPAEQQLLQRLAVIPAPFTADLARAVADGTGSLAVLVEQSLLQREDDRYRMLETVREYAAGDPVAAMAGLTRWARQRAATLAAGFIGPAQAETLASCAADQDNLVAALRWALDHDDEPAAVDVATALFQLWTVRGQHLEACSWARRLLHTDDPAARIRTRERPNPEQPDPEQPNPERLAWLCVLIDVNAGSTGDLRLSVLARRVLRGLPPERISPRIAALAAALPGLGQGDPDRSRADAATLIAHPDPYVQGMGHFIRAVLTEDDFTGEAERAYRRFEAVGDHWGMGMAAHAAGHASGAGEWLRRSQRHWELVGAAQDARSARVLLDTQLALAGDADAERRLLKLTGDKKAGTQAPSAQEASDKKTSHNEPSDKRAGDDEADAWQAALGLAELSWQQKRYDEARHRTDTLAQMLAEAGDPELTQPRIIFRLAAAVIRLWITGEDGPANDTLLLSRTDVLASHDRELLGTWAMAGAELAAARDDTELARELWSLATRVGVNASRFLPQGRGPRLATALGGTRDPLLAEAAKLTGPALRTRITTLMSDLLADPYG